MMETGEHRCKSCGIVFADDGQEIDKCLKKRLYCDLCLAQKNPWSETEQRIRRKYIQATALAASVILILIMAVNWSKNKYDSLVDYFVGFGLGYVLIWTILAILSLPVLMMMKKPHKEQIKVEKEKYAREMEAMKSRRNAQLSKEGA